MEVNLHAGPVLRAFRVAEGAVENVWLLTTPLEFLDGHGSHLLPLSACAVKDFSQYPVITHNQSHLVHHLRVCDPLNGYAAVLVGRGGVGMQSRCSNFTPSTL